MQESRGPDFSAGIAARDLPDGALIAGRIGAQAAVLIRRGSEVFALGAFCTHYHCPLAQGLVAGDTLRCACHHASFDLRTGEAIAPPALDALESWRVERVGDMFYARERLAGPRRRVQAPPGGNGAQAPPSVLIVGAGAAGIAAAITLRREGYAGPVRIVSAERTAPCDRPNLSKDVLAGTAPEEWLALRPEDFYAEQRLELLLGRRVRALDIAARFAELEDGSRIDFGALLLAPGAEPVRIAIPGAGDCACYLRTPEDCRAIITRAQSASRALVLGASFIGLEVAASLRARQLEVEVVAPEAVPMARVLGEQLGRFIQHLHEAHGVRFHLGCTVQRVDGERVTLSDGSELRADLLVLGVGVRPAVELAERAGLAIERGVRVDACLQTSAPGVYAAGDVARWPEPRSGQAVRVEHWVLAQRQGQTAARNMLGARERFDAVPFFWSQHYDQTINYVGHAEGWDAVELDGAPDAGAFRARYLRAGRTLAVATVARDRDSLEAELAMEHDARSGSHS